MGRLEEAVDSFRKALVLREDYAEAYFNLGIALRGLGRIEEAIDCHSRAIRIAPQFVEAYHNLGNAFLALGQLEKALEIFETVDTPLCRAKALECLYSLKEYEKFYEELIAYKDDYETNIRAVAISAFVSQQLGRDDPLPFCKFPLDFVRIYRSLNGMPDAEDFLVKLINELKSLSAIWEPRGKSTIGGYQTPSILFDEPTSQVAELESIIRKTIEVYRASFAEDTCGLIRSFPDKFYLRSWFVRLLKSGYQNPHIHTSGWISGVFYLNVPQLRSEGAGAIEFSLHGYDYPILNENYPILRHDPVPGDIVLFPSSLFHRTIPFNSDEERMIVAFDVIPE